MMPSFFIAHGSPGLAIEKHQYNDFLESLATRLPQPKAIILFSAHWESRTQLISGAQSYETIYDFYGFPEELYQIQYPAAGDPALAQEIQKLFAQEGIPTQIDPVRGLDHGAWVVLHLTYPKANIPVVALSVNPYLSNEEQYRLGQALSSLREKDILIIGSGGTSHNLRRLERTTTQVSSWAEEFEEWMEDKVTQWDTESLFQYEKLAPHAQEAVPTSEHFIPLLLVMGTGDANKKATLLHRSFQFGSLSLVCWQFE